MDLNNGTAAPPEDGGVGAAAPQEDGGAGALTVNELASTVVHAPTTTTPAPGGPPVLVLPFYGL